MEREFNEEGGVATKRLDSSDVFRHKTSIDNRRRVIASGDGFGPGLNENLAENSEQGFGSIDTKVKYEDEFDVLFELDGGLYGRAGKGSNATKIDGFIQYRIEVIHSLSGNNPTVASSESTIQGYLERSQEYYWVQRLKWRRLENNKQLTLRITIMDVDTDAPTKFRVHAFGYDLA